MIIYGMNCAGQLLETVASLFVHALYGRGLTEASLFVHVLYGRGPTEAAQRHLSLFMYCMAEAPLRQHRGISLCACTVWPRPHALRQQPHRRAPAMRRPTKHLNTTSAPNPTGLTFMS